MIFWEFIFISADLIVFVHYETIANKTESDCVVNQVYLK